MTAATHEDLARIAQRQALVHVAHGRTLQLIALRNAQRQIDATMSGAQARDVLQQEIDEHAQRLNEIADQLIGPEIDRDTVQQLVDELVEDADEGLSHA